MRRLFRTWGQRPGFFAGFPELITSSNNTGTQQSNFVLVQDALNIAVNPGIITRACRATRWGAVLTYASSGGGTPTISLDIRRGAGCVTQSVIDTFTFTAPNALGALNCASGEFDPHVMFDAGDLWRISNTAGGGISPTINNYTLRVHIFFELR